MQVSLNPVSTHWAIVNIGKLAIILANRISTSACLTNFQGAVWFHLPHPPPPTHTHTHTQTHTYIHTHTHTHTHTHRRDFLENHDVGKLQLCVTCKSKGPNVLESECFDFQWLINNWLTIFPSLCEQNWIFMYVFIFTSHLLAKDSREENPQRWF